jgi:hypothetical protein
MRIIVVADGDRRLITAPGVAFDVGRFISVCMEISVSIEAGRRVSLELRRLWEQVRQSADLDVARRFHSTPFAALLVVLSLRAPA